MKHYSGIDYDHFLDDIRDMYPFSVDEAVLVELIANSLDARTTLLDIRVDPEQRVFELTDNGGGMDARGFEMYHNFSTSFKRKGQGIGFAGLGAKLALKIAESITTETRQQEQSRSRRKPYWGASEWKFERKRKTVHPVWYDVEERRLAHHGTRVRMNLKRSNHMLLQPDEIARAILRHYYPIVALPAFYESLQIYRPVTVLVNGEALGAAAADLMGHAPGVVARDIVLKRGRVHRPFALARFEFHPAPLPESMQGIGISTFGKIVRREYFKEYFPAMDRVSGIIEVPELVECLTTSKCDFRKEGNAGNKYYRFTKAAQHEFRRWLESLKLIEHKEQLTDKDMQRLQRLVTRIVEDIPDLQQFYGFRTERDGLVPGAGEGLTGSLPQPSPAAAAEPLDQAKSEEQKLIQEALEQAARGDRNLAPGEEIEAVRRARSSRSGPTIRYVDDGGRADISWMEGDMVLINTAHPAYRKAAEKKVIEYHNVLAAAMAMLREVPTAEEKLALLERFMNGWGRL